MIDYEYYHDQYRHAPRNSASYQKELLEYNSTTLASAFSAWPGSIRRSFTTTYIDGSTVLGPHERPYSVKDQFPKGKGRRKPSAPCEKKINTGDTYMSLVPAERPIHDATTARSEKTRSPLSMATATATQWSTLPDVQRKSADIRHNRLYSATIFDDETNEPKYYGRCATTRVSGAWVRRYKSINESQTLADLLRDQVAKDKTSFKKRTCGQLFLLASPSKSSFTSSFIKRRPAQY